MCPGAGNSKLTVTLIPSHRSVRNILVAQRFDVPFSRCTELAAEENPLIVRVDEARGTRADHYMLSIPADMQEAAEDLSWRKGKIHALRPVFRELGLPGAFVYEALENSPAALRTVDIINATGLGRTAVSEALEVLAAWNLAGRDRDKAWTFNAAGSLRELAEHFGVMEAVAAQKTRYRNDRIIWKEWLSKRAHTVAELLSPDDDYPWEAFEGPPEEWTLSHMAFTQAMSRGGASVPLWMRALLLRLSDDAQQSLLLPAMIRGRQRLFLPPSGDDRHNSCEGQTERGHAGIPQTMWNEWHRIVPEHRKRNRPAEEDDDQKHSK